jgi:hypothetical protein
MTGYKSFACLRCVKIYSFPMVPVMVELEPEKKPKKISAYTAYHDHLNNGAPRNQITGEGFGIEESE